MPIQQMSLAVLSRATCASMSTTTTTTTTTTRDRGDRYGPMEWAQSLPRYHLAHSANLPTGLYILPSEISSFLNRPNISQHLLGRFSRSFYDMKGICVNLLDPDLFSNSSRDVAMATDFWQNLRNDLYPTLAFRNGFDYRNFDSKIFNGNVFST